MIVVLLLLFNIPNETYITGGNVINELLGTAVVTLAYPLLTQRNIIKQITAPIFTGVFTGAFVGITSGVLFAKWVGFDKLIIYSISPKSVTTPAAMDVATSVGAFGQIIFKWSSVANYRPCFPCYRYSEGDGKQPAGRGGRYSGHGDECCLCVCARTGFDYCAHIDENRQSAR